MKKYCEETLAVIASSLFLNSCSFSQHHFYQHLSLQHNHEGRAIWPHSPSLETRLKEISQNVRRVEAAASYYSLNNRFMQTTIYKSGSGIKLADENGNDYLLTAFHVIDFPSLRKEGTNFEKIIDKPKIEVGGSRFSLQIVCYDKKLDYALLGLPSSDFSNSFQIPFKNASLLNSSDKLYLFGFPVAHEKQLIEGKIDDTVFSAQGNMFQFSTQKNPAKMGMSGGPVFSEDNGELFLVGILHGVSRQGMPVVSKIDKIVDSIKKCGTYVKIGR